MLLRAILGPPFIVDSLIPYSRGQVRYLPSRKIRPGVAALYSQILCKKCVTDFFGELHIESVAKLSAGAIRLPVEGRCSGPQCAAAQGICIPVREKQAWKTSIGRRRNDLARTTDFALSSPSQISLFLPKGNKPAGSSVTVFGCPDSDAPDSRVTTTKWTGTWLLLCPTSRRKASRPRKGDTPVVSVSILVQVLRLES
jgi:hypothetical protein